MISLANKPSVWIIILNWNGLEDTMACLESLRHVNASDLHLQIVVIDNASAQDPRKNIEEHFTDIIVVRLERNYGFAGGCNYGISMAMRFHADYVLLLNNDTIVHPGFLEPLVGYLASHPHVGVVSPLICYNDNPERVWFAGAKIIITLGYFEHQYVNRLREKIPIEPIFSDYVTGCCMLILTSVISKVGLFDERLFAYFEDADFCMRLQKLGLERVCLPTSVIWHKESASTRRDLIEGTTSPLKHYLSNRNRITTMLKYANVFQLICYFLSIGTFRTAFFLFAFMLRRRWKKMVWFMLGIVDGLNQNFEIPRG